MVVSTLPTKDLGGWIPYTPIEICIWSLNIIKLTPTAIQHSTVPTGRTTFCIDSSTAAPHHHSCRHAAQHCVCPLKASRVLQRRIEPASHRGILQQHHGILQHRTESSTASYSTAPTAAPVALLSVPYCKAPCCRVPGCGAAVCAVLYDCVASTAYVRYAVAVVL